MIAESKIKQVREVVNGLSSEEILWLSGYLSGMANSSTLAPGAATNQAKPETQQRISRITVAYGTETGNAKRIATAFSARARKNGIAPKLVSLEQYNPADLQREEWFVLVISTQGEGEPPLAAKKFYDYVHQDAISLKKLRYSVLALGDTSYPLFCKAGEDLDQQLQLRGGTRVAPLIKLDTDYEEEARLWTDHLLHTLLETTVTSTRILAPAEKKTAKKSYTGTVQTKINLNGRGSSKKTFHIELQAPDVSYEPGDALGIYPRNKTEQVQRVLDLAGLAGDMPVPLNEQLLPLAHVLGQKTALEHLPQRIVKKYSAIIQQDIPATRMDFSDLLRIYPVNSTEQFIAALQILDPISPRLYSIASSPEAHPGEVHLTVGLHQFQINEQERTGLCSSWLSQRNEGEALDFYIYKNPRFKLQADDADLVMIGAGTGIAPFRSFVAQRDTIGACGRNWLFYGDRNFTTDFLYQTEWQNWSATGTLTKMNVAFSRDGKEKRYVQQALWEQRRELMQWVNSGATLYICGAKDRMSNDVEQMLLQIISHENGMNQKDADDFLNALQEDGRYLKDVY